MLLDRRDVNPDQADTAYGQTPLSWAARNGHSEVVKILLERKDVNPDKGDTFCSKYGYGAQSILLCGEYYASARGLRCALREEELCGR